MEDCLRLLQDHALEGFEKVIQRKAIREVVEECLHRQSGTAKDRRAAQNAGIRHDHSVCRIGLKIVDSAVKSAKLS